MNPLETFLKDVRDCRATGAAVAETSFYPALANLLNELGKGLRPKVRCIINLANAGAGLPDGGLFTPDQFQKASAAEPKEGQSPARGVVEVKPPSADLRKIARSEQVKRYSDRYGLVLLTNLREFLLLGRDAQGNPLPMESYVLAADEVCRPAGRCGLGHALAFTARWRMSSGTLRILISVGPRLGTLQKEETREGSRMSAEGPEVIQNGMEVKWPVWHKRKSWTWAPAAVNKEKIESSKEN